MVVNWSNVMRTTASGFEARTVWTCASNDESPSLYEASATTVPPVDSKTSFTTP